mmetsp:Transcript_22262/g.30963  ORF Transcript_22262/g.30963 Transcript_22262/m.30963 type:complete len:290 (-) Transcript_22262:776-1645(-)
MAHQLLLAALHHHHSNSRDQVCRLLPHCCALIVQSELDGPANLGEVGLGSLAQSVDNGPESIQHDVRVVRGLLLEGVKDAVDQQLLQSRVNVRSALVLDALLNGLHDHAAIGLGLVLQVLHYSGHNVRDPHLVRNLHCCFYHLAVVTLVQCHPPHPKGLKERSHDLGANVLRLHPVCAHTLLHHLEHDLLHLLVMCLELADQRPLHDFPGVVRGIHGVHQRNDVADRLEEGSEHFPPVLCDTLPQRLEYGVKALNTIGTRRLSQRCKTQRCDGAHLLVLICQPVFHDFN